MIDRRDASGTASRSRLSWAIFWGVSTLALGACFFAALVTGGSTSAGLALLCGLVAVGIAALFMASPLSANGNGVHGMGGGRGYGGGAYGVGGGAGDYGGGGGGGGDGGGGGGGC